MRPRPVCAQIIVGIRMALEEGLYLVEVGRLGVRFRYRACERNVDIVVKDDNEAYFSREIEDTIKRRVPKAGDFARNLRSHEFLVNNEFTNAREHARERVEHSADMIRRIHVRWVKASDHGIKTRLLLFGQRSICHGNRSVGKRVVVQRSVRVQVIRRGTVAVSAVRPLLLQRNAEDGHASSFGPHHVQKLVDIRPFLNIVGQMKMGIVEFIIVGLRAGRGADK
jgi:hypothetical protein